MFDLCISLQPHILVSLGSCAQIACIPASSYPQVHVCLLITSYRHILLSLGSCTLCVCWYPHTLTSLGSCSLGACWYLGILTSSYPQHTFPFDQIFMSKFFGVHLCFFLSDVNQKTNVLHEWTAFVPQFFTYGFTSVYIVKGKQFYKRLLGISP